MKKQEQETARKIGKKKGKLKQKAEKRINKDKARPNRQTKEEIKPLFLFLLGFLLHIRF